MIITVTLNPAVDHSIEVDGFKPGLVNKASKTYKKAGGKGINVSKTISYAGGKTTATGFLGGNTGEWISRELKNAGIIDKFIFTDKSTRTNIKIVDTATEEVTDINEKGDELDSMYLDSLESSLYSMINVGDMVVLSGSLPGGMSESVYETMILKSREKGAKVVLDATQEALKLALRAKPFMIKPNIHELEEIFDNPLDSIESIKEACYKFIDSGVNVVLLSMGGEGALLVTRDFVKKIDGIKVKVKNTVGAGDSMVGSFVYKYEQTGNLEEAFKYAVATATVHVGEGTTLGNLDLIKGYLDQITVYSV
ncbi:1-phosphofructokinase [Alkalibacter saccharofermentans]|uniref:Tagatose-6-phosphate kinase n=1 Tax=Alkalibacter saccharofermentans DSM 14828 TaxID=1120975 RepID=A0A1M4SCU9_9FIRM|nr:1-phosphofructokinase [Alkalibacter saccharofermentans]SHE30030.1 1-phosphofructokinase [Alkalibacter saccharofermentans DSM 14828]